MNFSFFVQTCILELFTVCHLSDLIDKNLKSFFFSFSLLSTMYVAFFYCEIDGSSLCLQCDMIVHVGGKRTHGRYLVLRQRIEVCLSVLKAVNFLVLYVFLGLLSFVIMSRSGAGISEVDARLRVMIKIQK